MDIYRKQQIYFHTVSIGSKSNQNCPMRLVLYFRTNRFFPISSGARKCEIILSCGFLALHIFTFSHFLCQGAQPATQGIQGKLSDRKNKTIFFFQVTFIVFTGFVQCNWMQPIIVLRVYLHSTHLYLYILLISHLIISLEVKKIEFSSSLYLGRVYNMLYYYINIFYKIPQLIIIFRI